jgi:hypothetical protein
MGNLHLVLQNNTEEKYFRFYKILVSTLKHKIYGNNEYKPGPNSQEIVSHLQRSSDNKIIAVFLRYLRSI